MQNSILINGKLSRTSNYTRATDANKKIGQVIDHSFVIKMATVALFAVSLLAVAGVIR